MKVIREWLADDGEYIIENGFQTFVKTIGRRR